MDHDEMVVRSEAIVAEYTKTAREMSSLYEALSIEAVPMPWLFRPLRNLRQAIEDLKDLGTCGDGSCEDPMCLTHGNHIKHVDPMKARLADLEVEEESLRAATVDAMVSIHECECRACKAERQRNVALFN